MKRRDKINLNRILQTRDNIAEDISVSKKDLLECFNYFYDLYYELDQEKTTFQRDTKLIELLNKLNGLNNEKSKEKN